MEELAGWYKFARLALLALALVGIAVWLYHPKRKERLEEPARRLVEEEEEER